MSDIHRTIQTLLDLPEGERLDWLAKHYPNDPAVRQRLLEALGGATDERIAAPPVPFVVEAPPEPAPSTVGKYEIRQRLGSGGMGTVFLARDPQLRRDVALKCLSATFVSDQLKQRFWREARAVAQLRHPNIVTVFEIQEHEQQLVIAMEYIPGQTLAQLIDEPVPLTLDRKLEILESLCSGLECAHRAGVMHRDIKPANVMVDTNGIVKLLDFGVAKFVDTAPLSTEITSDQVVIGTLGYIAPEHLTGGEATFQSDLFAVAVVAYEFLTLRKPFGTTRAEIAQRILLGNVPAMFAGGERLPSTIERAVRRSLALRPMDRHEDAAAMRKAFADARMALRRQQAGASADDDANPTDILKWASVEAERKEGWKLQPMHVAGFAVAFAVALVTLWPSGDSSDRPDDPAREVSSPAAPSPSPSATLGKPAAAPATTARRRDVTPPPSSGVRIPLQPPESQRYLIPGPASEPLPAPAATPPPPRAEVPASRPGNREAAQAVVAGQAPSQTVAIGPALERELREVLQQLERAYAQRSTPAVRSIYTQLLPHELAALDVAFLEASSYQRRFGMNRFQMAAPQGNTVRVLMDTLTVITARSGEVRNIPSQSDVTFQRTGASWQITAIREVR